MKFDQSYPARTIADWIDAKIIGDPDQLLDGMNEIHKVDSGDIMFVDVKKYFKKALNSKATGIILNEVLDVAEGKVLFVVNDPFRAYEKIGARFYSFQPVTQRIHPSATIHETARLEPGVTIGAEVVVGAHTLIQSNCYIGSHTQIGKNTWIQPNTTIGSEAFYFKKEENTYHKWTSFGKVIIEDDVVIGANCTIDKGVSGITRVSKGCRIDNMVHLGHGVVLGENCLLAAQVGIAGKTVVGKNVTIYGQVGIANGLKIGDNAVILAASGIGKSLEANKTYFGSPAKEAKEKMKELAALKFLTKER